jgi:outer membrane protein assembly factor BamC
MQRYFVNPYFKLTLVVAVASLGACSVLDGEKVDYKSSAKAPTLMVPPDLTQLSKETRYSVVNGGVSAATSKSTVTQPSKDPVAATVVADIKIERQGNQRWLVVNRKAENLWTPLRDFWQESGFTLTMDQSDLGIMETDWNENRANIPQDFIRSTIGKWLDSVYSTPLRDKYRTRLESRADGSTEIFISHRGMVEVYATEQKDRTIWQPRPADPELEAEFLRRLMLALGASKGEAAQLSAVASTKPSALPASVDGKPAVELNEGFDRAWRRVGLSLDRTGFTVEDRDRNKGVYFVRYVAMETQQSDLGFFKKLFGSSPKEASALKYQISVRSKGEKTLVSVLDAQGLPDVSETAKNLLKVLSEDLR